MKSVNASNAHSRFCKSNPNYYSLDRDLGLLLQNRECALVDALNEYPNVPPDLISTRNDNNSQMMEFNDDNEEEVGDFTGSEENRIRNAKEEERHAKKVYNYVIPDGNEHEMKYYVFQQEHLKKCYGEAAMKTSDFKSFKKELKIKDASTNRFRKALYPHILKFADEVHLSRDQGVELLKLLKTVHSHAFRRASIPDSWKTILKHSAKFHSHENEFVLKKVIKYPKSWKMKYWGGYKPKEVELKARDPIAAIATMLVDPVVAYGWKNHINLNSFRKYADGPANGGKRERLFGDIMSAEYAERTEIEMRNRTKEPLAVLMPILLNSDGVAVGGTNQQVCTVMGSIGNFSSKFLQSPDSKFCLGYIPKIPMPKNRIIKHLVEKVKLKITVANTEFKMFERYIDKMLWKLVLKRIKSANEKGVYLRLLNMPCEQAILVYPYFLHHIGDEPGQKRVCGMFEGNAKSFCIQCDFQLYSDVRPKFRSKRINEIKQLCEISEGYIFKKSARVTEAELQSSRQLNASGIHPGVHPFMTAPRGVNNDIFRTPYDLLHTWAGGIMKTLAFQCCVIIKCSNGNITLFDNRLSTFPRLPDCLPHVSFTTFPKGGYS
jgi:hypothetical protein